MVRNYNPLPQALESVDALAQCAQSIAFYRWHQVARISNRDRRNMSSLFQEYADSDAWNPLPMRLYLQEKGVRDLRATGSPLCAPLCRIGTLTNWWHHACEAKKSRKKLIQYQVLEARLANLDQDHCRAICNSLISRQKSIAKAYLDPDVMGDAQIAEENRQQFIASGAIQQHLQDEGIYDLTQVDAHNFRSRSRVGALTGWWEPEAGKQWTPQMRRQLIKHGVLKARLDDLEEHHLEDLCTTMLTDRYKSPSRLYLNPAIVGEDNALYNALVVVESDALKEYLVKNNNTIADVPVLRPWIGKMIRVSLEVDGKIPPALMDVL